MRRLYLPLSSHAAAAAGGAEGVGQVSTESAAVLPLPAGAPDLADATRDELAAHLRARYETGVSIRGLAAEYGGSYGLIHKLLVEAGATLRPRGGAWRKKRT